MRSAPAAHELLGAIEVLIQEGLTTFALPAACEAFAGVVAIFGARAVVGATRVADADGVRLAAESAGLEKLGLVDQTYFLLALFEGIYKVEAHDWVPRVRRLGA